MRTRVGKIARLPSNIRDELNRRLDDAVPGKQLVPWLNALPEAQQILATQFAGRPITEDNLSEWRKRGYQDWRRERERSRRHRELNEQYLSLRPEERTSRLTLHTEEHLAIQLAGELNDLWNVPDPTERWNRLKHLCREFCRLQKSRTLDSHRSLLNLIAADSLQTVCAPRGSISDPIGPNNRGVYPRKPNESHEG